jgi:hypothetical protein
MCTTHLDGVSQEDSESGEAAVADGAVQPGVEDPRGGDVCARQLDAAGQRMRGKNKGL